LWWIRYVTWLISPYLILGSLPYHKRERQNEVLEGTRGLQGDYQSMILRTIDSSAFLPMYFIKDPN
jgi:hypothetical protein